MSAQTMLMELPQEEIVNQEEFIFQENFNRAMDKKKVQIADINRATGVAIQTLWDWCKGYVKWPIFTPEFLSVAKFLEVKPEDLITKNET